MAIKTFTTGEVLTAADTNTYLANSGLVLVKSQTVGSGVSSVEVSGAFSSIYDNYRIIYTGGTASTANMQHSLRLGSTVSSTYQTVLTYMDWGSGTVNGAQTTNTSWFWIGGEKTNANGGPILTLFELYNPFNSVATMMNSTAYGGGSSAGTSNGRLNNTTSYTAFTLLPDSGTFTGGAITVYGYRKA
jgi:hypothetical protein